MKIKAFLISGIALFSCLIGLYIPAFFAEKNKNLLLVHPAEMGSPKIDVKKIEDFCEDEFPLSYEIPSAERASVGHAEYPVTVIGTNSSYARIMGFMPVSGSFFSKQAWTGKLKHAVLNEKAAFTLFGSYRVDGNRFRIRNDTWLVTGVIRDGDDDNLKIYVPSSVRGGEAASFIALLTGALDEAYIKSSLKNLGIREGVFNSYNLGVQSRLLWDRPKVILFLFASFSLLSLIRPFAGKCKNALTTLKNDLKHRYPAEIFRSNRRSVMGSLFLCLCMLLIPVLSLFLVLQLTAICLPWQDIPSLAALNRDLFYPRLDGMRELELISRVVFFISLAALIVFLIFLNSGLETWTKTESRDNI